MIRPGMTEEALVHVRKWNSKSIKSILARKDTWESKYVCVFFKFIFVEL